LAGAGDPLDDAAEDQRRDHQLDQVQEDVADDLEPGVPGHLLSGRLAAQPPAEQAAQNQP
jgi:hypothetical protein